MIHNRNIVENVWIWSISLQLWRYSLGTLLLGTYYWIFSFFLQIYVSEQKDKHQWTKTELNAKHIFFWKHETRRLWRQIYLFLDLYSSNSRLLRTIQLIWGLIIPDHPLIRFTALKLFEINPRNNYLMKLQYSNKKMILAGELNNINVGHLLALIVCSCVSCCSCHLQSRVCSVWISKRREGSSLVQ